MSTAALLLEFLLALAIVSGAGYLLTVLLGRLGATLRLTPAALGLAVAFGADSPELASSVSSLIHGHGEVGVGVVLGSNVFNIAVVLGVGALVAERPIKVGRAAAWFSGGAFLLSLLPGGALLLGWSSPRPRAGAGEPGVRALRGTLQHAPGVARPMAAWLGARLRA